MPTTDTARPDDRRGDPSTVPPGMQLDPDDFVAPSEPPVPPRTAWQRFVDALAAGEFERAYRALSELFDPNVPIGFVLTDDGSVQLFDATGIMPADTPLGPPFLPGVLDELDD